MASHFECIGFSVEDPAGLESLLTDLLSQTTPEARADGGWFYEQRDESGAAVIAWVSDTGETECFSPAFAGRSRLRVRPTAYIEDPECRFCDRLQVEVVDEDGEMFYPLPIEVDDIGLRRETIPLNPPAAVEATITGFAETLASWPNEEAFSNDPQTKLGSSKRRSYRRLRKEKAEEPVVGFAPESLVPIGMFGDGPPSAHALIHGRILQSERRTNAASGGDFFWAAVQTLGGVYDLVAGVRAGPDALSPEDIVQAQCWMTGRILAA